MVFQGVVDWVIIVGLSFGVRMVSVGYSLFLFIEGRRY